jgi:hypothetical protein
LPAAEISAKDAWSVFESIAGEAGIEAEQYSP